MKTLAAESTVPTNTVHRQPSNITLSVVVPVYNESDVIHTFHQRLTAVLDGIPQASEIVYVNDGSTDDSWKQLQMLPTSFSEHTLVALSRNFGKESAVSAGLEHCRGDAVILIDSDLQDPPELIPTMLNKWQEGADVVNMKRRTRDGESWFKKRSASVFYKLINRLSDTPIPENVGDFRLISRRVVDHINELPEKNRYMKGLLAWPGFQQEEILFDRDARHAGTTKWNYAKLFGLAWDGITAFSTKPLQLASWLGAGIIGITLLSMLMTALTGGAVFSGTTATFFMGGIQLLSVGLLGEYIGRMFIEIKGRPRYLLLQKTVKPAQAGLQRVKML